MIAHPSVSIVVPTRNGGSVLAKLLDAIEQQDAVADVVAIDSGSTDGTLELLASRNVRVIACGDTSFNHGATRNTALATVESDFAVLLVQDAVPAGPSWLQCLLRPFRDDPSVAGTYARQQPWPAASRLTAYYLSTWVAAQEAPRRVGPLSRAQFDAMTPDQRHVFCAFDNVCSCVRMSVWRTHPFRPTRIAEDLEWGLEVLRTGHRLVYVPDAVVWHSHERSVAYELQRTYVVHQRLQALFGLSTVPSVAALGRAVATSLPLHVRLAASEPKRRGRAIARAAGLAVALPLGQYLGARSAREGREYLRVGAV